MAEMFEIIGMDEIMRNLRRTLGAFDNEVVQILDRSALEAQNQAEELCAVDTGRLRASIRSRRVGKYTRDVEAGTDYAQDVEFGTGPHEIVARGKVLAFPAGPVAQDLSTHQDLYQSAKTGKLIKTKSRGAMVFRKRVQHPGTPAQPFMRPAFNMVSPRFYAACLQLVERMSGR